MSMPPSSDRPPERARQAVKNSAVISVFNGLSAVSILLLDMVIAATFGVSATTDAFFIAFTIPSILASVAMVSFNLVLVPILSRVLLEEGQRRLWVVVSSFANLSLLAGVGIAAIGSLAAPLLMTVFGAGLEAPAQQQAVSMARILFLYLIPVITSEVIKSALNAMREFAFPASSKIILNLSTLLVVVLYRGNLGIMSLVIGYSISTWLEFGFLAAILIFKGYRYSPTLGWRNKWTIEARQQLRYPLLGGILNQGNLLLERFLASFLPAGLVSSLVYARRIFSAADNILLGSITTAFLPRLSTQFAGGRLAQFKRSLNLSLKLAGIIALPMTALLITLSQPTIRILFQRGAFDPETTKVTAGLFSIYLLGIPPMAARRIFFSAHYAMLDARTPFILLVISLVLSLVLYPSLFFALGATGLALTLPLVRLVAAVLAGGHLFRRIGAFGDDILGFVFRVGSAAALVAVMIVPLQAFLSQQLAGGLIRSALQIAISATVGLAAYVVLLVALRVKETEQAIAIIRARFHL